MNEELPENDKISVTERSFARRALIVMALAMGLPSTILGVFGICYWLVKNGYISWNIALCIVIFFIINTFILMLRYVKAKKTKS